MSETMKRCANPDCLALKPLSEFGRRKTGKGGLQSICRVCLNTKANSYRHARPEQTRAIDRKSRANRKDKIRTERQLWYAENRDHVRAQARFRKFGITPEAWAEQLARQGNRCAICESPDPQCPIDWHVDHDHGTSGIVRGILCFHCNSLLGHAKDSIEILQKAIAYLQDPPWAFAGFRYRPPAKKPQIADLRPLAFNGETHTVTEWAQLLGVRTTLLHTRLKLGWTLEDALTTRPYSARAGSRRLIIFNGQAKTAAEWARETGIAHHNIRQRLAHGWTVEAALTTPDDEARRTLTYNGETLRLAEWARRTGIDADTIAMRLKSGWTIENALAQPVKSNRSSKPAKIEYNGESLSLKEWSTRTGLSPFTIVARLDRGWSVEDALTRPSRKHKKKDAPILFDEPT